ncbi:MAG: hypothetical protein GX608_12265 [Lentisphaerae bacterium]|nr:hypothetical protein [Lentisphaerota bacterium]
MRPVNQLFHNEDCTQFFWTQTISDGTAGEAIDRYVDVMAEAGVTDFVLNTASQCTLYESRVWDSFWTGYDPDGPDSQPYLKALPSAGIKAWRKGIGAMLAVHRQGIDYPARVIQRCRHGRMAPWISLRMNDCHGNNNPDLPGHGSFWKNNPGFYRNPGGRSNQDRCLDYAHPEVRDHYMAIIGETLDRYDIDGLELDFMREPYLFKPGQEREGALILAEWLRAVRKRVDASASKRGHHIRLGVRVPSRPDVSSAWGLDAVAWAKEGLIDLLVPTPRWDTIEFDMPVRQWREQLGASKIILAGGLEVHYMPYYNSRLEGALVVTPEQAMGAALMALSEGADAVYLFNYFQPMSWGLPVYLSTLKAMASRDELKKRPRTVSLTYRDITAPGERYKPTLPATGRELLFAMKAGPIPDSRWRAELMLWLPRGKDRALPPLEAFMNGKPCEFGGASPKKAGMLFVYEAKFNVPMSAFSEKGLQEIKVAGRGPGDLTIQGLNITFRPGADVESKPVAQN